MRSTFTRGTRRLLVTAGVMTLGLYAAAPATFAAANPSSAAGGGHTGPSLEHKVWVCHPTGPVTWELIHVASSAVPAHEEQGGRPIIDISGLEAVIEELDLNSPAALNRLGAEEELAFSEFCEETFGDDDHDQGQGDDQGQDDGQGQDDDQGQDEVGFPGAGETGGQFPGGGATDGAFPGGGDGDATLPPVVVGGDGPVTPAPVTPGPATPATPPEPAEGGPAEPALPGRPPKPVVISHDEVAAPVAEVLSPVTPATPSTSADNEVLGVFTTRTPTGAGTGLQSLPRTGSAETQVLAFAGAALLVAGLALEATSRRASARPGGQPTA